MRGDGDGAGADEKEDVKPEELVAERAAASTKVVLSEGPFSESETDQSDKDKDCGEERVLGGKKKSETECGDENETRPLTGNSCALIPQVRSQACDRKKFFCTCKRMLEYVEYIVLSCLLLLVVVLLFHFWRAKSIHAATIGSPVLLRLKLSSVCCLFCLSWNMAHVVFPGSRQLRCASAGIAAPPPPPLCLPSCCLNPPLFCQSSQSQPRLPRCIFDYA